MQVEDSHEMFINPRSSNFTQIQQFIRIHVILEEILKFALNPQQEKEFYKSVQTMAVLVMQILDDASYNSISNVILKYKIDYPEKIKLVHVVISLDGISLGYDSALTKQQRKQKKVVEEFLSLSFLSEFISRLDVNKPVSRTYTLASAYKEIYALYEFMRLLSSGIDSDTYSMKIVELAHRNTNLSTEENNRIIAYANSVERPAYENAKDAPDVLKMKIQELEKAAVAQKKTAPPKKLLRRVSTNDMFEDKTQDTQQEKPKSDRRKSEPAVSAVDPIKTLYYNVRDGITACKTNGKYLGQAFRKLYRNEFIYNPEQKELKKRLSNMGLLINAEVVEAFERIEIEFSSIKAGTPYSEEDGVKLADLDKRILSLRGKITGFSTEIEAQQKKIPPRFAAVATPSVAIMSAARKVTIHKNRLLPEVPPPTETQLEILWKLEEKRRQREIRRGKR